jgi:hypothetical protein
MGVGSGQIPQTSSDSTYGTNPGGYATRFGRTGPGTGEPQGPRTEGVQTPDKNTPPRSGASDVMHSGGGKK